MGAIADALMAYAQPLLEGTDGSPENMQKAFDMSIFCYNLALLPEDQREEALAKFRSEGRMSEEQFVEFRRDIIDPMIRRHEAMFPGLHNRVFPGAMAARPSMSAPAPAQPRPGAPYPGTDRYAPCPCGSGKKYKFCCGKKGR
ncbi:MAG: SEC-C metal-binding domain-containing protein [Isosphaeraceae bacterium]